MLTNDVTMIEAIFWGLVRKDIPELMEMENLAVGANWMLMQIDDPVGK